MRSILNCKNNSYGNEMRHFLQTFEKPIIIFEQYKFNLSDVKTSEPVFGVFYFNRE
jgi:hypothetical protein